MIFYFNSNYDLQKNCFDVVQLTQNDAITIKEKEYI